MKTKEELETLSTKNLLAYYKAERKRNFSFISENTCPCCGELYADLYGRDDHFEFFKKKKEKGDYLKLIKEVLSKREHVEK